LRTQTQTRTRTRTWTSTWTGDRVSTCNELRLDHDTRRRICETIDFASRQHGDLFTLFPLTLSPILPLPSPRKYHRQAHFTASFSPDPVPPPLCHILHLFPEKEEEEGGIRRVLRTANFSPLMLYPIQSEQLKFDSPPTPPTSPSPPPLRASLSLSACVCVYLLGFLAKQNYKSKPSPI
jgi:hypothetical protein